MCHYDKPHEDPEEVYQKCAFIKIWQIAIFNCLTGNIHIQNSSEIISIIIFGNNNFQSQSS